MRENYHNNDKRMNNNRVKFKINICRFKEQPPDVVVLSVGIIVVPRY